VDTVCRNFLQPWKVCGFTSNRVLLLSLGDGGSSRHTRTQRSRVACFGSLTNSAVSAGSNLLDQSLLDIAVLAASRRRLESSLIDPTTRKRIEGCRGSTEVLG
jgi:hypothetical protein